MSTGKDRRTPRGNPADIDRALREWPDAPRSERYWEDLASRVDERVDRGEPSRSLKYVTDASLLSAPLPSGDEDSHNWPAPGEGERGAHISGATGLRVLPESVHKEPRMGTQHERERDRRSFQDLAKLAASSSRSVTTRAREIDATTATKDDSGLIDLRGLAQSDPAAVDRASVTPLSEAPAAPVSAAPMAATEAPRVSGVVLAPAAAATAERPQRGGAGRTALFLGLAAVAAGAFVAVRVLRPAAPVAAQSASPAATVTAQATAPAVPEKIETATTAAPTAVVSAPAAPVESAAPAVSAAPPPVVAAAEPAAAPKKAAAPAAKSTGHATKATEAEAPAVAVAATPAKTKEAPPAAAGTALDDAIKSSIAGGSAEVATTPAAAPVAPTGSVPQRPSQGALAGALGAVMPGARACLGPDDPISRARVVFGSSGAVESVTVTGSAAGKPAEACIKAALGKARVPPFAEASSSAPVVIRP